MDRSKVVPRPLKLEELVPVLLREHEEQRYRLTLLKTALVEHDYVRGAELVGWLHESLSQHIVDEETQMLKLLLDAYGKGGGQDAISVFQQHRAIDGPLTELNKLAPRTPEMLALKRTQLEDLDRLFAGPFPCGGRESFPTRPENLSRNSWKAIVRPCT